jgi:UDP-3-O-[3-hydroxymyristoyl] glucosamine N-acyltransferase
VTGDAGRTIRGVAPLDEAGASDLSILAHPRYRKMARESSAGALLVKEGFEMEGRDQIVVADPHAGLAAILPRLYPPRAPQCGVSPDARISPGARLGAGVAAGPFAVVESGCTIGAGTILGAGSYIAEDCEIGGGTVLFPNVTVYERSRIGDRVTIHAGTVIGSDGFGYATQDGVHVKVPQVGAVVIEDDVEIGASVTIDRGSIGMTRIGRGTKIDNLVQIGHNVQIGAGCLIVAQVGISGSTRIGAGTIFAGQAGAAGHLRIGSRVTVASKSAVYDDLEDGSFVAGIPALDHRRWKRAQAAFARLPELQSQLRDLVARLEALEKGRTR